MSEHVEAPGSGSFDNAKVMAMLAAEHPDVKPRSGGAHRLEDPEPPSSPEGALEQAGERLTAEDVVHEARGLLIDLAEARANLLNDQPYHGEDAKEQQAALLRLGRRTIKSALELATHPRAMEPAQARELVGLCADLADQIKTAAGDESALADFEQLKLAVYGPGLEDIKENYDRLGKEGQMPIRTGPMLDGDTVLSEAPEDSTQPFKIPIEQFEMLVNPPEYPSTTGEYIWFGSPIVVEPLNKPHRNPDLPPGHTDPSIITLRLGTNGWYYQVGDAAPILLKPAESLTLGRKQLGGNKNISRSHLTITSVTDGQAPDVPGVIQVTDHSHKSTVVSRYEFPYPQDFQLH